MSLWYGSTGTCKRVRQSKRLHRLKYIVKTEWHHFKKDWRLNLKMLRTATITAFGKRTWTQNGIRFGETWVIKMGLFGEADTNISTTAISEQDNVISK
jgi:hypothetical protein